MLTDAANMLTLLLVERREEVAELESMLRDG
jgi:hypothetical protein